MAMSPRLRRTIEWGLFTVLGVFALVQTFLLSIRPSPNLGEAGSSSSEAAAATQQWASAWGATLIPTWVGFVVALALVGLRWMAALSDTDPANRLMRLILPSVLTANLVAFFLTAMLTSIAMSKGRHAGKWRARSIPLYLAAVFSMGPPLLDARKWAPFLAANLIYLLQLVFVSARLDNAVSWKWGWTLFPAWLTLGVMIVGFAVVAVKRGLPELRASYDGRRREILVAGIMAAASLVLLFLFLLLWGGYMQGTMSRVSGFGAGFPLMLFWMIALAGCVWGVWHEWSADKDADAAADPEAPPAAAAVGGKVAGDVPVGINAPNLPDGIIGNPEEIRRLRTELAMAEGELAVARAHGDMDLAVELEARVATMRRNLSRSSGGKQVPELITHAPGGLQNLVPRAVLANEPLYRDLLVEKRALQKTLHEYRQDFVAREGRELSTAADRAPVEEQYDRYQSIKAAIAVLEDEFKKYKTGQPNAYLEVLAAADLADDPALAPLDTSLVPGQPIGLGRDDGGPSTSATPANSHVPVSPLPRALNAPRVPQQAMTPVARSSAAVSAGVSAVSAPATPVGLASPASSPKLRDDLSVEELAAGLGVAAPVLRDINQVWAEHPKDDGGCVGWMQLRQAGVAAGEEEVSPEEYQAELAENDISGSGDLNLAEWQTLCARKWRMRERFAAVAGAREEITKTELDALLDEEGELELFAAKDFYEALAETPITLDLFVDLFCNKEKHPVTRIGPGSSLPRVFYTR